MPTRLELPTLQNWSCHSCAGCCRQHAIEITAEEKRRIERQKWQPSDGVPAGRPLFEWHAGPFWSKRYRLGHQSDGACVFLDEQGLCRIHAKHGEASKPLACRLYPYAFHPAGKKFAVSLRFSCPSVVANRGAPVAGQSKEIRRLAGSVIPEGAGDLPPPPVSRSGRVEWPEFHRLVAALDGILADGDVSLPARLLRALLVADLLGQARFDKLKGQRVDELLGLLGEAASAEIADPPQNIAEPSGVGRMQFRLLAAAYARKDTLADLDAGWRGRWTLLRAATRFTRGTGNVPPLQPGFAEVPFADLEAAHDGLPEGADELLTRYFRVKLAGLHFCGRGYYDTPLVEGFQSLALVFPVVLWLARWLAASDSRRSPTADDVGRALAIADHHHGFSPALGSSGARRRVRLLAGQGEIGKLIVWYSR